MVIGKRVTDPLAVGFASVEYLVSNECIADAWKKVRSNKGSGGVDDISIDRFPKWLRPKWRSIKSQLLEKRYSPTPALRVEIPKESGGVRNLGIPCVLDRVIMQSMARILGEMFNPGFSASSYGYMPERSVQAGRQIGPGVLSARLSLPDQHRSGHRYGVEISSTEAVCSGVDGSLRLRNEVQRRAGIRWMDKKTTENVLLETVAQTEASNSRTDQAGS